MCQALIALLFATLATTAAAQTVSNTARANWQQAGRTFSSSSNTVAFDVTIAPAAPVALDIFRVAPNSGQTIGLIPSQCVVGPIGVSASATPGGSVVASVTSTTTVRIGEQFFFRLIAPSRDLDPKAIDKLEATLVTSSGDKEAVLVYETGPNTGVFIGAIPTTAVPPAPIQGDCKLSVATGDKISIELHLDRDSRPIGIASIDVLADPFGLVFDSEDGAPVDGAVVSMIDAVTGAPAKVFADDGVTTWPSTVVTGQAITDGAGNIYKLLPGEFRFPLAKFGSYRLTVTAPAPYSAPSTATAAQLSGLTRPDGKALLIAPGSYGNAFAVNSLEAVRLDIPLDRPNATVSLSKTVSRATAAPGDVVFYSVTARNPDLGRTKRAVVLVDSPSTWLRLRPDTIRLDGVGAPDRVKPAADGHGLTASLGDIPAGATRVLTYAMSVRADAPPGQALNRAETVDARGNRTVTSVVLRIEHETIAGRMTLIGRITDGGCSLAPRHGVPGVRVMLEDGSFAITDVEGRYHFDGLVPGSHVVQAITETLPEGSAFTDCTRSTRSAGSAISRFIVGQGGSLAVADFHASVPVTAAIGAARVEIATDRAASGGETDWLAQGDGPSEFLFPGADYNPRAPVVRIVIRHRKGQTVDLSLDGKPVDKIAFDGAQAAPGNSYAVSMWRGIPLSAELTRLSAVVRNADGSTSDTLTRDVHFSATPARVEGLAPLSHLTADGSHRPVLAVRILDRFGRPVHSGLSGTFRINAPYESAFQVDALQARALSGLDRAAPTWTVKGDDGIAMIELAPTMVSGALRVDFSFTDGTVSRSQTLESWIVPGAQKWTLVGLAEGAVGARSVADAMGRTGRYDSDLGKHARVAFYAKGRILGSTLLTVAYDSAKQRDDQRLLGAIDPNAYYTVFADGSDRRFDAASRNKLYIRIESRSYTALFGDFVTGFDQTQLARNQRTATGVRAEANVGAVHVAGYAARIAQSHRRDELQGAGISGPYRLSSRAMLANSEIVTIEVRDRFRSEKIVERRTLTRFIDYDIDMLAGTIRFKEPILSRDVDLNPQFIVIDYEVDQATGGAMNAGLRAEWSSADRGIRIGATAITDTGSALATPGGGVARTDLGAIDLKARIGTGTELRAEAAASRTAGKVSEAWLVELEHHDGRFDVLAYARSTAQNFGLGQINGAERGRRKIGADARMALNQNLSLTGSAWYDDSLTDTTHREALELAAAYRTGSLDARLGVATFRDRLATGANATSTVVEGALSKRMLGNKLEVSVASSIALGSADSVDLPARHRLAASYAVTRAVKLVGSYEIAKGSGVDARTARAGFELTPWNGARVIANLGQSDIVESGRRNFAAFGLSQSLEVTKHLTVDATLDSSRTLGRIAPVRVINPAQPVASGGHLGDAGTIDEDFTAVTLGGTYRAGRWSTTLRGELRDGEFATRKGVTLGTIRQLGEGSMVGAGFTWTQASGIGGAASSVFDGAVAVAHRPANSPFAILAKLEFRADTVRNAIAGEAGPAGRSALTISGDAQSRRIIGSMSANWSPSGRDEGRQVQRSEFGMFVGVRHNFDRFQGFDLAGTTVLGGLDAHIGLGDRFEIGGVATVRHSLADHTTSFAFGPQLGFSPFKNTLLTIGYNISGFRDRDFAAARSTDKGVFATLRMKFDTSSLGFLGLGR